MNQGIIHLKNTVFQENRNKKMDAIRRKINKPGKLSPAGMTIAGFLILIALGTMLLMLPWTLFRHFSPPPRRSASPDFP